MEGETKSEGGEQRILTTVPTLPRLGYVRLNSIDEIKEALATRMVIVSINDQDYRLIGYGDTAFITKEGPHIDYETVRSAMSGGQFEAWVRR
jgi:hypothetical protein